MTIARTLCVLLTLTAASALQPAPHVRPALRPAARAVLVASEPVAAVGTARSFSASWGVLGVIGILAKAIKRLAPHAVQPLVQRDLTLLQWGLYGTSLTFFAYVEGYKAFQCKFSPLVVQRAMTLAAPGAPVFELVETGALEARIGLPSALAAELEPGETYKLTGDRGPVEAELRSVTGVINAGQRTVASVFEILDPEAVSVGAVVRMNMTRQVNEPGLWVPVTALSEGQRGLWSIYIARKDDDTWTVRPGLVEVIQSEGDQAFVRGAVSDGDLIIIDGLQRITPGQEVRPRLDQTANAADEG